MRRISGIARFARQIRFFRPGIHVSHRFDMVEELLQAKNPLAIFDIDNTLVVATGCQSQKKHSGYGSDVWFTGIVKIIKQHPEYAKLFLSLIKHYCEIQPHIRYTTTESSVTKTIAKLKKEDVAFIGLTARSPDIADITIKKLASLHIKFSYRFEKPFFFSVGSGKSAFFYRGIIFCAGQSKKVCLDVFLKTKLGKKIFGEVKNILFIDDNEKYCDEVHEGLTTKGFKVMAVHYNYVEKHVPSAKKYHLEKDRETLHKRTGSVFSV